MTASGPVTPAPELKDQFRAQFASLSETDSDPYLTADESALLIGHLRDYLNARPGSDKERLAWAKAAPLLELRADRQRLAQRPDRQ